MRAVLAVFMILIFMPPVAAENGAFAGRTALVMVDDINCGYCRKWDREIGPGYGKSAEGRYAPLAKIRRGDPRLAGFTGLAYTPTFILIVNGREHGRIVGYAGPDFFWGELDRLIKRGGFEVPEVKAQLLPMRSTTSAIGRVTGSQNTLQ